MKIQLSILVVASLFGTGIAAQAQDEAGQPSRSFIKITPQTAKPSAVAITPIDETKSAPSVASVEI